MLEDPFINVIKHFHDDDDDDISTKALQNNIKLYFIKSRGTLIYSKVMIFMFKNCRKQSFGYNQNYPFIAFKEEIVLEK